MTKVKVILKLTHWGLVTPYGDIDLGKHMSGNGTWANVDLSSMRSLGIHLRPLSLDDVKIPINKTGLKIAAFEWQLGLPGANKLTWW